MTTVAERLRVHIESEDERMWRKHLVVVLIEDTDATDEIDFGNVIHARTAVAGVVARGMGRTLMDNPYLKDRIDSRGYISVGRRGFRNAWQCGWEMADRLVRSVEKTRS